LSAIPLDKEKIGTIPIYFNIKDIKDGTTPKKGTYVFSIEIKEGLGDYQNSAYGAKQTVSISVQ
jgi:hypothetical protein